MNGLKSIFLEEMKTYTSILIIFTLKKLPLDKRKRRT